MNKEKAQQELDSIKDRVKELEKIINEPAVSILEEMSLFLFHMINGCTIRMTGEKEVTYYKGNTWIVQSDYKHKKIWVNYAILYDPFERQFKLRPDQVRNFITSWLEINMEIKGLQIGCMVQESKELIEADINWKGSIPEIFL